MSRPPVVATSRNMSAWSSQAVSQVGWRLAVASRAKIRRPRVCGFGLAILLISARKLSTSDAAGVLPVRAVGCWSVMGCLLSTAKFQLGLLGFIGLIQPLQLS